MSLTLATFTRADLETVGPWFTDSDTGRYLGGPEWPAAMLDVAERAVGQEFRGALQTGAHHYLGRVGGRPVGYIDCGIFAASRRCLEAAGFALHSAQHDFEGMLYYRLARARR